MKTSQKRSTLSWALVLVIMGGVLYLIVFRPGSTPDDLAIATGTPGGTYTILGSRLARILDTLPEGLISHARAIQTAGSIQNVDLLIRGDADIGLSPRTTLVGVSPEQRSQLRVLADLYHDVVHVLVRKDADVRRLRDLAGKKVYVGRDGSGMVPVAVEILNTIGVEVTETTRAGTTGDGFGEASRKLQQAILDAAFVFGGMPTEAVSTAMESGCCELLDLEAEMHTLKEIESFEDTYSDATIPAFFYANQDDPIRTISTTAHLISRADLPDALAAQVVDALYDNIRDLLRAHTRAEDIEFRIPELGVIDLHPGVARFWEGQKGMLQIATGAIDGIYYSTGKAIQQLLEQRGIRSSVVHTQGSLENLDRLAQGNTLALMQYEVALAAYWGGDSGPVYGMSFAIPDVSELRRVATFRPEVMHAVVRRDRLDGRVRTIAAVEGMRVALGPDRSGSRLLAETILEHHGVTVQGQALPVGTMVEQLNAGQIDAGFFTAAVPSEALKRILADPTMRLLSVDPQKLTKLSGALTLMEIDAGTYGSQLVNEPSVKTVGTQSVLVTTEDPRIDVGAITRAVFEGAGFLEIDGGTEALATNLPDIPLHPEAVAYYQQSGHLPYVPQFLGIALSLWLTWVRIVGGGLLIPAMLFAACQWILKIRRDRVTNEVGRRVFGVSVEAAEPHSVKQLLSIRREIRGRVKRRWWQGGEIDKERWRVLEGLVNLGVDEAKQQLERALITDIRQPPDRIQHDSTEFSRYYGALRERIWKHLENGELDAEQHGRLFDILADSGPASDQLPARSAR